MRRALVIVLALGLLALALLSMSRSRRAQRLIVSFPLTVDTLVAIPGLTDRASIVTDRWGIPHVEAANLHDLYLAWGYVTARDRLWELEVSRRAASGRMWEWFGNATLRDDGGAQLLELAEHGRRAWERDSLDAGVRETVEAYAAGINAYIDRCHRGEATWPDELATIAREPEPWRPADTYLMLWAQGLLLDLGLPELDEAEEIAKSGYAAVERRRRFEMTVTYATIPDSAAERMYGPRKAGMAARMSDEDDVAPPATRRREMPASTIAARVSADDAARAERALGRWASFTPPELRDHASNVFAVGPKRSASGKPMLANDPHLSLGVPSPLHLVHLRVPGVLDVAGASVPGLPTIASGRTRVCAWGITALNADVSDVYADSLSADGKQVRWRGGWYTLRDEPYAMRFRLPGGTHIPAFGQHRRYGPHGPVVSYDRKRHLALELRWGPPDSLVTLRDLLGLERSTDAREVARRFSTLTVPCLNMVAADVQGHVVYQVAGAAPRRAVDPGLGAQPGDGRQEWVGWTTGDSLPRWEPPADGFVVNCNNLPVDPGYGPAWLRLDFPHDRALRIAERLGGDPHITLDDLRSVQNDVHSRAAERFLPRLLAATEGAASRLSPRAQAARDTLSAWDLSARRGRVAPTLYRAWYGAFLRRSGLEGLPGLALAALAGEAPNDVRAPKGKGTEGVEKAAAAALDTALARLDGTLGPDVATWTWGRAHRAQLMHRMQKLEPAFAIATVAADGDNSSPCVGPSRLPWSTTYGHAPVFRHLVDLAVPDRSWVVLPPGNSGDRRSPHASDLLERWVDHRYVPLLLDPKAIEAARESETRLEPKR
jgi:penicillin amidase